MQLMRPAIPLSRYHAEYIIYITTGIYRCQILDLDRNFARISKCQESARINAFHIYICKNFVRFCEILYASHLSDPQTGASDCGLHLQNYNIFSILEIFFNNFLGDPKIIYIFAMWI